MATENSGTAAVDTSPSLVSVIGEMYGDFSDAEPERDAGAPPADTPESAASSEGTPESAPAGELPVEADPATVPDASAQPTADLDPLEGSSPLAYTVNGASRTFEGITVLKDGGAIIDPDALEKVQQRISERDHLYERSQEFHAKEQTWERLSTHTYKDTEGRDHTLTGRQGLEALRSENESNKVALQELVAAIRDPGRFMQLVDQVSVDANGRAVPDGDPSAVRLVPLLNGHAWKELSERATFLVEKKQFSVQQQMARMAAPPPPADPDVASFAEGTISALMQQHGVQALSPADQKFVQSQFPLYTRPSTPQEKATYGTPYLVQPQFIDLLKTLGARAAETAKVATTATTVAKANQAKLAAAAVGRPGAKQTPKIAAKTDPVPSRADDFDSMWDRQQAAAAGALRAHNAVR